MKFRMYVDEVGNSDVDSSDDPNHRFLSLTGIIIDLDYVGRVIHPELEALRRYPKTVFRSLIRRYHSRAESSWTKPR